MSKLRVYELAKELNVSSKDLIEVLMDEFNVEVKNHMSVIEEEDAELIKELLAGNEGKLVELTSKTIVDEYEDILNKEPKNENIIKYLDVIKENELKISSIALEVSNLLSKDILYSFLKSHIHMMINRLFRTQQRTYELVIYDCLSRYYSSFLARNK